MRGSGILKPGLPCVPLAPAQITCILNSSKARTSRSAILPGRCLSPSPNTVSYTHLRAHETEADL
eukprot:1923828-Amphidinium_carterae.1